jgi:hypothetical protein
MQSNSLHLVLKNELLYHRIVEEELMAAVDVQGGRGDSSSSRARSVSGARPWHRKSEAAGRSV